MNQWLGNISAQLLKLVNLVSQHNCTPYHSSTQHLLGSFKNTETRLPQNTFSPRVYGPYPNPSSGNKTRVTFPCIGWSIDLIVILTMGLLLNSPYTLGFQTPGEEVFGPQTHT